MSRFEDLAATDQDSSFNRAFEIGKIDDEPWAVPDFSAPSLSEQGATMPRLRKSAPESTHGKPPMQYVQSRPIINKGRNFEILGLRILDRRGVDLHSQPHVPCRTRKQGQLCHHARSQRRLCASLAALECLHTQDQLPRTHRREQSPHRAPQQESACHRTRPFS
jgi:hypothetical protein